MFYCWKTGDWSTAPSQLQRFGVISKDPANDPLQPQCLFTFQQSLLQDRGVENILTTILNVNNTLATNEVVCV